MIFFNFRFETCFGAGWGIKGAGHINHDPLTIDDCDEVRTEAGIQKRVVIRHREAGANDEQSQEIQDVVVPRCVQLKVNLAVV